MLGVRVWLTQGRPCGTGARSLETQLSPGLWLCCPLVVTDLHLQLRSRTGLWLVLGQENNQNGGRGRRMRGPERRRRREGGDERGDRERQWLGFLPLSCPLQPERFWQGEAKPVSVEGQENIGLQSRLGWAVNGRTSLALPPPRSAVRFFALN